jgi:hypothetical protein
MTEFPKPFGLKFDALSILWIVESLLTDDIWKKFSQKFLE